MHLLLCLPARTGLYGPAGGARIAREYPSRYPDPNTVALITGSSGGIGAATDRRVAVNEMLVRASEQTW
jgi:hypothetical protein